jgi:hypothetical protein
VCDHCVTPKSLQSSVYLPCTYKEFRWINGYALLPAVIGMIEAKEATLKIAA